MASAEAGQSKEGTLKAGLGRRDKRKKLPGSWSGPTAEEEARNPYDMLYENDDGKKPPLGRGPIIAADLLHIPPIPGVRTLQIDFLSPQAQDLIRAMLVSPSNPEGKADLILSDMAANFTGNKVRDTEASLDICLAVFDFVKKNLRTVHETGKTYAGSLLYVLFLVSLLSSYLMVYALFCMIRLTGSNILRTLCSHNFVWKVWSQISTRFFIANPMRAVKSLLKAIGYAEDGKGISL